MKHNGGQHNDARKPEEILAEIERTRHEMDSTLTAIEHRLTPGQLFDQGLDYLRNSGGNEFVQNLGTQAKNNPMPIALVGIGLAWLMASGKNPPARYSYTSSGPSLGERAGEMRDKASGLASSMSDKASGMASSTRSKVSDTTQAVGDRIRQARDSLTSTGQSARQRVSDLSGSARQQIDRARSGMDYMMREQPLALGAIGLAIGAVIAAMAPRTRKEDELMGETRDQLLDQAKEVGKEKLEQAKEVANSAVGAAAKEAEQRGLKPQPAQSDGGKPSDFGKQSGSSQGGNSDWNKPSDFGKQTSSKPAMSSTSIGTSGASGNLP
jgi:gas vesicle protein